MQPKFLFTLVNSSGCVHLNMVFLSTFLSWDFKLCTAGAGHCSEFVRSLRRCTAQTWTRRVGSSCQRGHCACRSSTISGYFCHRGLVKKLHSHSLELVPRYVLQERADVSTWDVHMVCTSEVQGSGLVNIWSTSLESMGQGVHSLGLLHMTVRIAYINFCCGSGPDFQSGFLTHTHCCVPFHFLEKIERKC